MEKHIQKIKKIHIEAFGHAWDAKVNIQPFKIIFLGLILIFLVVMGVYIANVSTSSQMTTGSRASETGDIDKKKSFNSYYNAGGLCKTSNPHILDQGEIDRMERCDPGWSPCKVNRQPACERTHQQQCYLSTVNRNEFNHRCTSLDRDPLLVSEKECNVNTRCSSGWWPCNDGTFAYCQRPGSGAQPGPTVVPTRAPNATAAPAATAAPVATSAPAGGGGTTSASSSTSSQPYCTLKELESKPAKEGRNFTLECIKKERDRPKRNPGGGRTDECSMDSAVHICEGSSTPCQDGGIPYCEWGEPLNTNVCRVTGGKIPPCSKRNWTYTHRLKNMEDTECRGLNDSTERITDECRVSGDLMGTYCQREGILACETDQYHIREVVQVYCSSWRNKNTDNDIFMVACNSTWPRDPLRSSHDCTDILGGNTKVVNEGFTCNSGWSPCHALAPGSNIKVAYCQADPAHVSKCEAFRNKAGYSVCIQTGNLPTPTPK